MNAIHQLRVPPTTEMEAGIRAHRHAASHYTLQAIAAKLEAWRASATSYVDACDTLEDIDKLIRSAT